MNSVDINVSAHVPCNQDWVTLAESNYCLRDWILTCFSFFYANRVQHILLLQVPEINHYNTITPLCRLYRLMQTLLTRWDSTRCRSLNPKDPNFGKCSMVGLFSSSIACSSNLLSKSGKCHKSMDLLWLCTLAHCVQYTLKGTAGCSFWSIDKLHLLQSWPSTLMIRLWGTQKINHWQIWSSYYQHFIFYCFVAVYVRTWDHCTRDPFSLTIQWFYHQRWWIQEFRPFHPYLWKSIGCPKLH